MLRAWLWLLVHLVASLGWLLYALCWPPMRRGQPCVFYGFWYIRQVGGRRGVRTGGFMKPLKLHTVWPNHPYRFNLIYLVSSWLPWGAPGLVLAAKLCGRKIVLNQNGVLYPGCTQGGSHWRVYNAVNYVVWRWADQVFYQSAFCQQSAERWLPRWVTG